MCIRDRPSPFNFSEQAVLSVPAISSDPRNQEEHSEAVAAFLPELLADATGALVLFTSWRQMQQVEDLVPSLFAADLLVQGGLSRSEMIREHKRRIDQGDRSILFGLASFAEGVDLPGSYCEHVVIVKIPFAVPDDPVSATLCEWIENKGGNAFQEISIPDATIRLVQACGRLLRTEQDRGTISILDRRLVTQRYGKRMLAAMPPYRRDIST